jgi:hypothetical protein
MPPLSFHDAVVQWPDGHRATLFTSAERAYWQATEDDRLRKLNYILQVCYDSDLSVEQLARKCLAHGLCPPNGRLLTVQHDSWLRPTAAAPEGHQASAWI